MGELSSIFSKKAAPHGAGLLSLSKKYFVIEWEQYARQRA